MKAKELKKIAKKALEDKSEINHPLAEEQYKHLIEIFTELASEGVTEFSFAGYVFAGWHYSYYNVRPDNPSSMFSILLHKLKNEGFVVITPIPPSALLGNQPDPAHKVHW